jgi:hypothetical protein
VKVSEFGGPLFAAVGAEHAPEFPGAQTSGANEITTAAFDIALFGLKKTELRETAAERTRSFTARKLSSDWGRLSFREPTRVRLQDRLGEELRI